MIHVLKAIMVHNRFINWLVVCYVSMGFTMLGVEVLKTYGFIPEIVHSAFLFAYLGATAALLQHFWKETRDKHN